MQWQARLKKELGISGYKPSNRNAKKISESCLFVTQYRPTVPNLVAVPTTFKEEDAQMVIEALLSDHGDS